VTPADTPADPDTAPRQVLLFSGHMIDAPDRATPRFPAGNEATATAAIATLLDGAAIKTGPRDLAICGAACGGDLIFAEACLDRGSALELYIPFDEAAFLTKSVDFAGPQWRKRYFAAKAQATLHVMPDELGPLTPGDNAYERNNMWMLDAAARFGATKLVFICLWDGQGGDGPGGARHLMDEAGRRTKRIHHIDTRTLWT
jgi:hypothetical protein